MPHQMFLSVCDTTKKAGTENGWMNIFHINLHRHYQQRAVLSFTTHTNHMLEFLFLHKIKTKNSQ